MLRILFIGDVHAKVEDLEDCRLLQDYVLGIVRDQDVSLVVFLGDQYDAHAIKHVEVERYWRHFFMMLGGMGVKVVALVGNHDRPGNAASTAHSMQIHDEVVVVDKPTVLPVPWSDILFLPYYHDPKELVKAVQQPWPTFPTLAVCHAALKGGHYDNGQPIKADAFYGKDVADPDDFPQGAIISGHIHSPAEFGKVWYPGSPRWQTQRDANVSRAIWVLDRATMKKTSFSTDSICRRTWQLNYSPEDKCEKELPLVGPRDQVLLNVRGPLAFCEEAKRNLQEKGFRTKTFATDRGTAKVAESKGIPAAFEQHFSDYKPKYGTSKEVLRKMLVERLGGIANHAL